MTTRSTSSKAKTSSNTAAISRVSRISNAKNQHNTITPIVDPPPKYFGPKDLPHHGPNCQFVFPPKDDGMAIYEYPNEFFKYVGEWKNGKKHGKGRFFIGQNSYYEGEFKDGEINGVGDRYYPNGSHYHGDFVNGEFNGHGIYTDTATNEVYTGEFLNNRRHGEGELKMGDGTIYKGFFFNHKRHGDGEYTDPDGNNYKGEWNEGRIEGKGVMHYSNGDVYTGEFLNGKKNGKGTIEWAAKGLSYTGDWINDTCTYEPTSLTISDLPPITPGTTLSNIVISVVGGDGECGRKLRMTIEIGRIDPNTAQKKPVKGKKNEVVEHVPKFLVLNTETNDTFLDMVVEQGSVMVPPIPIPLEAENSTYSLLVIDLSEENPLPQIMMEFQFIASAAAAPTEKSSAKGRVSKRGANSRSSDRRTNTRK
ncbi:hypothetical protein TRFO_10047 [Tritrichomonas foetus]|uniref:MORN repeat-containing protein 1 n=1 Tax=Tritrichomonas foetus TaxID=1144522 RepID=A0A1J4JCH4_9EUKA|nr:hypothetical protein TRFO_10047 [Tritrichomonas foetus]|eukprot:OHS96369.1 hypothetical protein TRFO_10047 [Tritrichomonas foetus]